MARILQDGFETEGKEIDTSYISGSINMSLDIAEFLSFAESGYSNYNFVKYGICSPRGGYGKKGYEIEYHSNNKINTFGGLKYDLSKLCNDTSELFYRLWFKPIITDNEGTEYETRLIPLIITDVVIENEFDKISFTADKFLQSCNCVIRAHKIDQNTYELKCYCNGTLVYSYNFLNYNQWVKIDVRLKVGDAENGIFQLRINDKLITTFNGNTGTTNPKYMYNGRFIKAEKSHCKFNIDDIAINDTSGNVNNSWCGNGSIVGILPTANGSKTMFTPSVEGTQNFENVDDLTPDGDVTYNSSYALNDVDLFKFTIPEELEIPPTETINAISVVTSAKFVEQPTDIGHIVSDGTSETLLNQHMLSNDYTQQSSILEEKSNGSKYKVSDIEGLEFGYKTLASSEAQEE